MRLNKFCAVSDLRMRNCRATNRKATDSLYVGLCPVVSMSSLKSRYKKVSECTQFSGNTLSRLSAIQAVSLFC